MNLRRNKNQLAISPQSLGVDRFLRLRGNDLEN